jgi:hypothetical protein
MRDFYTNTNAKDVMIARSAPGRGDQRRDGRPRSRCTTSCAGTSHAPSSTSRGRIRQGARALDLHHRLDKRERYVWNLTKIATSRDPAALELFQSLMLRVLGDPRRVPAGAHRRRGGRHALSGDAVDGGTMAQVFVYPIGLDFRSARAREQRRARPQRSI